MLTLKALCAGMETSDRYLSPRAARDWWTKGLLPRPRRHGLGRGKGTETFWTESRVFQQARTAYDLHAVRSRTDFVLLSLWLLGFPINLRSIRAIYAKLINRHLRAVHGRVGKHPDDIVGRFAETLARQLARQSAAPIDARQALADLSLEFLGILYGTNSELVSEGLAELWERAAPYIDGTTSLSGGFSDLHPRDEDIAAWVRYVKEMASLTAQRKTIKSASDYELMRARRLVLFVFGYLRRITRAAGCQDDFEEFGRQLLVTLGRPSVPILVAVLRNGAVRSAIMTSLLDLVQMLPPPGEYPSFMRAARLRTHH